MRTILIGDVHGCFEELKELIALCQPEPGDTLIFIGDLIDKGPDSAGVLRYVRSLSEQFIVKLILGNHEEKFLRYLHHIEKGSSTFKMSGIEEFPRIRQGIGEAEIELLKQSYFTLYLPDKDILLLHGGIPSSCKLDLRKDHPYGHYDRNTEKQLKPLTMTRYLNADGVFVEYGKETPEMRLWAETYDGRFGRIFFGHQPFRQDSPPHFPYAVGLDTGCVFGGWLSACILRETGDLETVSVKARKTYAAVNPPAHKAENTRAVKPEKSQDKSEGCSVMVIPLSIQDPENQLKSILDKYSTESQTPPIDSSKHHSFVKGYYIGENDPKAFLQSYSLDLTKLRFKGNNGEDIPFKDKFHDTHILINDKPEEKSMGFSFERISFFHNAQAALGYFTIVFKWHESNPDALLTNLAQTKFFRYVGNSNSKPPKVSPDGKTISYMVNDVLIGLFPECSFLIKDDGKSSSPGSKVQLKILNSAKPSLLHLVHPPDSFDIMSKHSLAYKILRVGRRLDFVAPEESKQGFSESITPILLDQQISLYLMSEGALVFDKNEKIAALINKHLPTFLLTLNQRQILIYMMEQIATQIPYDIGDVAPSSNASPRQRLAMEKEQSEKLQRLEELRTRIIKLQLKQIFYSISHNDELNLFLSKLQDRFRINYLLQDIKESIGELHQLLEANQERTQWLREKRREITINLIGLAISALGVISTMDTILSNNQAPPIAHNIGYGIVVAITAFLALYFWRRR